MSQEGFAVPRFLILILIILVGAIAIGVYLLNNPQIFRSRATVNADWLNAFEITNANDQPLVCETTQNPPVCQTNTLTVKIAVKDLSILSQSVLAEATEAPAEEANQTGQEGDSAITDENTEVPAEDEETVEATPTPEPASALEPSDEDSADETPTPTPTTTPAPVGSIAPSGGILSIKVRDQEIDFNTTNPVAIVLSSEEGAVLTAAEYDIPIVVTREDNSIQALVVKFNYQPGSSSDDSEATASASENEATESAEATGSAAFTPQPSASIDRRYDLNGDGVLNAFDTATFLQKWRGRNASDIAAIDFNRDGTVNVFDYATLKGGLVR